MLAASLVALLTAASSVAQTTYTWTGGGPTNAWSETLNWSVTSGPGNPPPPSDLNNTLLVLTGNTQTTNVLDQNLSANRLTFDANAGSFVVGGGSTLTLGTGGIAINTNNNQTVNANLAAGAGTGWLNNGTGVFTVNGAVNTGGFQITVGGTRSQRLQRRHLRHRRPDQGRQSARSRSPATTPITGQTNVCAGTLAVGPGGAITGAGHVRDGGDRNGTFSIAVGRHGVGPRSS